MKILISKVQALEIAHSLITGEKTRGDYGSSALQEAGVVINNILELKEVERELMPPKEPKKSKPLTIADL
jgi:hypothetical protein